MQTFQSQNKDLQRNTFMRNLNFSIIPKHVIPKVNFGIKQSPYISNSAKIKIEWIFCK